MNFVRTTALNGLAVSVRLISLFVINKILAIYVGPSGYALVGQFQNAMQVISTVANLGMHNGITKYTAEYIDSEPKTKAIWKTAGSISLIGTIIIGIALVIFKDNLSYILLGDVKYASIFLTLAIVLFLHVFNIILLSVLNGRKEINTYVIANICGSILSIILTYFFLIQLGLYGALLALAVYQSVSFFITLILCYRLSWFKLSYFFGKVDSRELRKLSKFTIMTLFSAICGPICMVLIRLYLIDEVGVDAAGNWEAISRLSSAYLMLITATMSVYFLPKFSEIKDKALLRKELILGYKFLLPISIFAAVLIFFYKDFVVNLLFSDSFNMMSELFFWQLIGDVLKVSSWLLSYVLIAKAMVKVFIFCEVFFSITLYFSTIFFIEIYGYSGVAVSYAVNYCLYFVFLCFVVLKYLNNNTLIRP